MSEMIDLEKLYRDEYRRWLREDAPRRSFRDILTGDNTVLPAPGYSAQAGWDACCGLGSPDGTRLLAALSA